MTKKNPGNKTPLLLVSAGVVIIFAICLIIFDNKKNTEPKETVEQKPKCIVSGCSGQYCVENNGEPTISTCEWKQEYQCYKTAKCEVQANGKCGFTATDELKSCLTKNGVPAGTKLK